MSSQLITLAHLKSALQRTKELDAEVALAATEALEEMANLVTELQSQVDTLEEEKGALETKVTGMRIPVCGGFWDGSTLGSTLETTVDLTTEDSSATVTAAESGTIYTESS